MSDQSDRLPIYKLCWAADMPRRDLLPILADIGLPVEIDPRNSEVYTSRSEFGEMLRSIAAGAQ